MRIKMLGIMAAAGLTLGGCATNRYGYDGYGYRNNDRQIGRAAAGAAIGAAAGAGLGAVVDGVSPTQGAIVGAIAGGAIGAATSDNNRYDDRYQRSYRDRYWYRDDRGYCYYVNERGERIYDRNARC